VKHHWQELGGVRIERERLGGPINLIENGEISRSNEVYSSRKRKRGRENSKKKRVLGFNKKTVERSLIPHAVRKGALGRVRNIQRAHGRGEWSGTLHGEGVKK